MRVLLLATPLDQGWRRNGTTAALVDLAAGLVSRRLAPYVLVRPGTEAPEGCVACPVGGGGTSLDVVRAVLATRPTVIHAIFAPRLRTALALAVVRRTTGARVVQTVASLPRGRRALALALSGDAVVATSRAMERTLAKEGVDRARLAYVPMPFALPGGVTPARDAPTALLVYGGDYEHGEALAPTLRAFAEMSPPLGVRPLLALAGRLKTRAARVVERRLVRALPPNVRVLGELPSLLPWIAAARAVVLPAVNTFAKLDHPRVLLEAIALGTRVIVGNAPSLAELVEDRSLGTVASDATSLREAMEDALIASSPSAEAIVRVLAPRAPSRVADAYLALYAGGPSR